MVTTLFVQRTESLQRVAQLERVERRSAERPRPHVSLVDAIAESLEPSDSYTRASAG
jgi:hypothetical protein